MAYIPMKSDTVLVQCTRILQEITRVRMERDEVTIQKLIEKKLEHKFWRISSAKLLSRQQAIKYLDEHSDLWGWRSEYAERDKQKVKCLLIAAQNSSKMYLTEIDMELLFR